MAERNEADPEDGPVAPRDPGSSEGGRDDAGRSGGSSTAFVGGSGGRDAESTPATEPTEPGDPAPRRPAPGWSTQSQASYEAFDSGGWGGPSSQYSGPVPRVSATDPPPPSRATAPGSEHQARPRAEADDGRDGPMPAVERATQEPTWHADHHEPPAVAGVDRLGTADSQHSRGEYDSPDSAPIGRDPSPEEPTTTGGLLRGLFDLSFGVRVTRLLVPIVYVLVLVYLGLDFFRSIYEYAGLAAAGLGDFGGLLMLIVVGGLKVVVLAALARLGLELCRNVADLLATRTGHERVG